MADNIAKLDLDALKDNPNAHVLVTGPNVRVRGLITAPLSISAASRYTNVLESQAQESLSDKISGGLGAAGAALSVMGAGNLAGSIPSFTLRTAEQSADTYQTSERPSFTVELIFVALRSNDDVRIPVSKLYKATMPTFSKQGAANFLQAPLGYQSKGMSAQGTCAVRVGTWFQATWQLIKNVSFTFSREVTVNGYPLYASGSITFEPYRMISVDELLGYMLLNRASSGSGGTGEGSSAGNNRTNDPEFPS